MKLLALLEDPDGPSARHRVHQLRPTWESARVAVESVGIPSSGTARRALWRRAANFDVVLIQRRLLPPWQVASLRRHSARLIFDFDDAIEWRDHAPHASFSRRAKFRALVRAADLVVAGSAYLAARARHHGARWVEVSATPWGNADGSQPLPEAALRTEPVRRRDLVLFTGQPSTVPYLKLWAPALEAFAERGAVFEGVVLGAPASAPLPRGFEARPWSARVEEELLASATLGLAPLPDDPWSRGKCGLRLLRYLSAGLPAVASAVGAQEQIGADARSVFLVAPGEDPLPALESAWRSGPELRSAAARERGALSLRFGAEAVAASFLPWFERLGRPERGYREPREH